MSCCLLAMRGRLDPVKLSFLMMPLVMVEDDLTGRPNAVVITSSLFIAQSLELAWNPGPDCLFLQAVLEACFHISRLLEAVRRSSIGEVIIQRESAPVLRTLEHSRPLFVLLSSPAAAVSSLPSFCSLRSLSSQAFRPAAVAVVWLGASPSSLTDHCGNLGWGQRGQSAAGAWESGYSRTRNPTLHFLSSPSLCKRWAVVV